MTCKQCGQTIARERFLPDSGKWVGVDCGCARTLASVSLANPYSDLTLDHIFDERGQKVRVTSIHQLREAEKRFGFKHHVANMEEKHFSVAPAHRATTVGDHYQRKFARG